MMEIREIGIEEMKEAFPLVSQLRTHLNINEYIELIDNMVDNGYRAFGLFDSGKIVSYAGFAVLTNFYYSKHIWLYDLVVDKAKQGQGYGKQLLSYIEQYAKDNTINCIALSSGLEREDAHNFYVKGMYYEKSSYVFKKILA